MATPSVSSSTNPVLAIQTAISSLQEAAVEVLTPSRNPATEKRLVLKAARDAMSAAIATSFHRTPLDHRLPELGLALTKVQRDIEMADPDFQAAHQNAIELVLKVSQMGSKLVRALRIVSKTPGASLDTFAQSHSRLLSNVSTTLQNAASALAALIASREIRRGEIADNIRDEKRLRAVFKEAQIILKEVEPIADDQIECLRIEQRHLENTSDLGISAIAVCYAAELARLKCKEGTPISKLVIASATIVNAEITTNSLIKAAHNSADKALKTAEKVEKKYARLLGRLSLSLAMDKPFASFLLHIKSEHLYKLAAINSLCLSSEKGAEEKMLQEYKELLSSRAEFLMKAMNNPQAHAYIVDLEKKACGDDAILDAVKKVDHAMLTLECTESQGKVFRNIVIPAHPSKISHLSVLLT